MKKKEEKRETSKKIIIFADNSDELIQTINIY